MSEQDWETELGVGRVSIRQEVETVREALLWMQEDLKYRDSDAVGALDRIERKYQDADKNWLEMTNLAEGIEVERDRYREALQKVAEVQPGVLAMLQRSEFVFVTPLGKPDADRTPAEQWEKLAFTLYSTICEVDSIARQALKEEMRG